MSCPGTAAPSRTASRGTTLLPQLPHSATLKADCKDLEVRGSTSRDSRRNTARPATCVDGAVLPCMSSEEWRPATGAQSLKTDEVLPVSVCYMFRTEIRFMISCIIIIVTCIIFLHVSEFAKLMELIGIKLQANKFLSLRQAFRAFDSRGHGTITKEAFYRILCNALAGITQSQYSALLKRSASSPN